MLSVRKCFIISAAALLVLTACSPGTDTAAGNGDAPAVSSEDSTFESDPADAPETENVTAAESEEYISDNTINEFTEQHELFLPVRTADEALEITRLELPSEINGHQVSCTGLIDEHTFLVLLYSSEGALLNDAEYGLYDMSTGEYRFLFKSEDYGICAYDSRRIVLKRWASEPFYLNETESSLYLFDIENGSLECIREYTPKEHQYHFVNNVVLLNDKVYYDEVWHYTKYRQRDSIYVYDILTGETELLADGAIRPTALGGDILFLTRKDGEYSHLGSLSGEYDSDIGGEPSQLAAGGGKVFALMTEGGDEKNPVRVIKELTSGEYILKTDATIAFLSCGDAFAAFIDFGHDSRPVVCDIKNGEIIVFENTDCLSWAWFFYGDIGVLSVYEDGLYMFRLREDAPSESEQTDSMPGAFHESGNV